jgi:hypothetical protein
MRVVWIMPAVVAVAFAVGAREDLRGHEPPHYDQISAADRRMVEARKNDGSDRDAGWRRFRAALAATYDHRRANPGRRFDGLVLGEFPSEQEVARHEPDQRLDFDSNGRLTSMTAKIQPPGYYVIEGIYPPGWERACREVEQRLIDVWGKPDDDGVWRDPPTHMHASLPIPCELRFELD